MEEIEARKLEYMELKKNFQTSSEYYDSQLTDSRTQIKSLKSDLNEIKSAKAELEHANTYLTEQLKLLRHNIEELSFGKTKEVFF